MRRGRTQKFFRGRIVLLTSIGFDFQFRSVCADSGPDSQRVPPFWCHRLNDREASVVDEIDGRLVGGLVVLVAVADARSFGRAAERLGMTQSGVSRAIAKLEARLGARLLDRTSRAVTLTDEGRSLYEQVVPHLAGIGEAAAETSRSRNSVRGRLRVNVDPLFSRSVLSPKLSEFLLCNPMMELRLETRDRIGDLVSDGFDMAIRFGEPSPSALISRRLLDARILTVASPAYIARHGKPQHPNDLASEAHQCIRAIDTATGRPFEWEFWRGNKVVSVAVNGRLTVTDAGTKLGTCLAGFGIAQVIDLGLEQHLSTGTLVNLFPDWSEEQYPLYVYYVSRNYVPAKVRKFIDFVIASLNREGGTPSASEPRETSVDASELSVARI
jgi:DNA-binding transcriptional LysR family regulator